MATALESVMTLGPSPQKINTVLPNSSCILIPGGGTSPLSNKGGRASALPITMLDTSSQHGPMSSASSTTSSSSSSSSSDLVRCKRRINFTHLQYAIPHAQPVAVARRNARERNRVKQVNNGFSTLRQHIPFTARNKKMSKVETLRCAVEYIRSLQELLDSQAVTVAGTQDDTATTSTPTPIPSPQPEDEIPPETNTVVLGAPSDQGYYSSPESVVVLSDHTVTQQHHFQGMYTQQAGIHLHHLQPASLSPPCSAPSEPASSPTPSFTSESESYHQQTYEPPPSVTFAATTYDNYEPMSPDNEELLDVIWSWQQSQ